MNAQQALQKPNVYATPPPPPVASLNLNAARGASNESNFGLQLTRFKYTESTFSGFSPSRATLSFPRHTSSSSPLKCYSHRPRHLFSAEGCRIVNHVAALMADCRCPRFSRPLDILRCTHRPSRDLVTACSLAGPTHT